MLKRFIEWLTGFKFCEHQWEKKADLYRDDSAQRPCGTVYWCPKCLATKTLTGN